MSMNFRKFGNTDLMVSEIGFGAWAIGGNAMVGDTPIGWGKSDDQSSVLAINTALDQGINFFDTADFYGLGHSEDLLGQVLNKRQGVIIATKVGHVKMGDSIQLNYSKDYIVAACELSLKRLKRETIDYYQLHSARLTHLVQGECIEAMETLRRQGKIRYWGLSLNTFHPQPEADFLMENHLGDGFQLVYNIINQRAINVVQKAAESNYGIIARMPLQFGLLTGKIGMDAKYSPDDHRSFRFTPGILHQSLSILDKEVWPLCSKYNIGKIALALNYILSDDAVSTVIPGMRTIDHAIENTKDLVQLQESDKTFLRQIYNEQFAGVVQLMEAQG